MAKVIDGKYFSDKIKDGMITRRRNNKKRRFNDKKKRWDKKKSLISSIGCMVLLLMYNRDTEIVHTLIFSIT